MRGGAGVNASAGDARSAAVLNRGLPTSVRAVDGVDDRGDLGAGVAALPAVGELLLDGLAAVGAFPGGARGVLDGFIGVGAVALAVGLDDRDGLRLVLVADGDAGQRHGR